MCPVLRDYQQHGSHGTAAVRAARGQGKPQGAAQPWDTSNSRRKDSVTPQGEKWKKKNQHKKHTTQQPSTNRDSSTVEPHSAVTSFSSITLTRLFFSLTYLLSQSRSPFFSPLSMLVPSSANLNKKHTCWKWLKGNMCRVSLLLLPTLQLLMNFQTQKDISTGNPQRGLIALLGD